MTVEMKTTFTSPLSSSFSNFVSSTFGGRCLSKCKLYSSLSLLLDIIIVNEFSHQIVFSLEETECLSQFNIVIDRLTDTISFNITSSDRERGTVTHTLSNFSTDDVCSVRGSVYGSNDIGDSQPVQIQLPEG